MGNAVSLASMLTGSSALQSVSAEAGMAVLKKTNDIAKQQGNALVQLLEESLPQTNERLLDIYA
jgi:hypothetical protein